MEWTPFYRPGGGWVYTQRFSSATGGGFPSWTPANPRVALPARRHATAHDRHSGIWLQKSYQHRPALRLHPGRGGDLRIPSRWSDAAPGYRPGEHRQRGLGRQRLPLTEQRGQARRSYADQPHPPAQAKGQVDADRHCTGQCGQVLDPGQDRACVRPSEKTGSGCSSAPSASQ